VKCDFCGLEDPAWSYPCEDFVATGPPLKPGHARPVLAHVSGGWAACDGCSAYIERGDLEGLARSLPNTRGVPDEIVYGLRADLYLQFQEHRTTTTRVPIKT
jgi:hypothetical protein